MAVRYHLKPATEARRKLVWPSAAFLLLLACPSGAGATPAVIDLELREATGLPSGKAAMAEGDATVNGDRFTVANLSIFQPVAVTLLAANPADDLRLKLGKFNWDENFQGGSTRGSGQYTVKFRTQGDLLLSVAAPQPAGRYTLLIWAGDEITPEMEPVLVPASQAGGWQRYLPWAAGALALGALAWFLSRRRKPA